MVGRYPVIGFSSKVLPVDLRGAWSDNIGNKMMHKSKLQLPHDGHNWKWVGPWELQRNKTTDSDGILPVLQC